jgi:hypothetical protein
MDSDNLWEVLLDVLQHILFRAVNDNDFIPEIRFLACQGLQTIEYIVFRVIRRYHHGHLYCFFLFTILLDLFGIDVVYLVFFSANFKATLLPLRMEWSIL